MAENVQLHRPAPGQAGVVPVGPDARLEFDFDQGAANFSKDGQNFVLTFDDGATLTLEGFYNNFGDNTQPPTLIVQGNELPGEQFLAALDNPDLMPAAGPAAGPLLGGGLYEDAALAGVGGVDRLDKLGFDGWSRGTAVSELYQQNRPMPGGVVSFDVWSKLHPGEMPPGNTDIPTMVLPDGVTRFVNAMPEDGRWNQHLFGYDDAKYATNEPGMNEKQWGEIILSAALDPGTHITAVSMSGFPEGAQIEIRDANGDVVRHIDITSPSQVVSFPPGAFEGTSGVGTPSGVFMLLPQNDSDADLHLNTNVILTNMWGSVTQHPPLDIVIDAVADKPDIGAASLGDAHGSYDAVHGDMHQHYTHGPQHEGWQETHFATDARDTVTLDFHFSATIGFHDFADNSEQHYALIEAPGWLKPGDPAASYPGVTIHGPQGDSTVQLGQDNLICIARNETKADGVTPMPEAPSSPTDVLGTDYDPGRVVQAVVENGVITGYVDANGDPVDSATVHVFFQVPVANDLITPDAGTEGGGSVSLDMNVTYSGSVDELGHTPGVTPDGADFQLNLRTGAMAQETPSDAGEVTLDNNTAFTWVEGGVNAKIDLIQSELQIKAGWASEGNNDAKHIISGGPAGSVFYDVNVDGDARAQAMLDPDSTLNQAGTRINLGAPITLSISGGEHGVEYITTTAFTLQDASRGTLLYAGTLAAGATLPSDFAAPYSIAYTDAVLTYDGNGVYTFTYTDGSQHQSIDGLYFQPATSGPQSYNDADVGIHCDVTVSNVQDPGSGDVGTTLTYKGDITVVIDAVADRSANVAGGFTDDQGNPIYDGTDLSHLQVSPGHQQAGQSGTDNAHTYNAVSGNAAINAATGNTYKTGVTTSNGWETDAFKATYDATASHTVKLTVATDFPDHDGSEYHYILVQNLGAGWSVDSDALEGTGFEYAGTYTYGGVSYFMISVPDSALDADGKLAAGEVTISLKTPGTAGDASWDFKVGSMAVEGAGNPAGQHALAQLVQTGQEPGREYDLGNNVAVLITDTLTYKVDVINSTLTVQTGWASEGNNDAKHLGDVSSAYVVGSSTLNASTGNAAGNVNTGAPITFSIGGGAGSAEHIESITITCDDNSHGTLQYTGTAGELVQNLDGSYTFTFFADGASHTSLTSGLQYVPNTGDYSSGDVKLDYTVVVKNDAGASATLHGTSTVVIDAVADKPTGLEVNQQVYDAGGQHPLGDGAGERTAQPGENVQLTVDKVQFHDYQDGSERHFIFVKGSGEYTDSAGTSSVDLGGVRNIVITSGGYTETVTVSADAADCKITLYAADGTTILLAINGAGVVTAVDNILFPDLHAGDPHPMWNSNPAAGGDANWANNLLNANVTPFADDTASSAGANAAGFKIPVLNELLEMSNGADVKAVLDVQLPPQEDTLNGIDGLTGDGTLSITLGGYAEERNVSGDAEFDYRNNYSGTMGTVDVQVGVVTSVPWIHIDDKAIFENLTPRAHTGDETLSNSYLTPDTPPAQLGVSIQVGGLHAGEDAKIVFTVDYKNHPDAMTDADFSKAFDSAKPDDVMRIEIRDSVTGDVVASFPIEWDGHQWVCTVEGPAVDAVTSTGDLQLYFMPGYNFNSADLSIGASITVTDAGSGAERTWSTNPDPMYPEVLQLQDDHQNDVKGLNVSVDAVAQQPNVYEAGGDYGTHVVTDADGATTTVVNTAFKSGDPVQIGVQVGFRDINDATDKSEQHSIVVQAIPGWGQPGDTLTIHGSDGLDHTVTVSWTLQPLYVADGSMQMCWVATLNENNAASPDTYVDMVNWGVPGAPGEQVLDVVITYANPPVTGEVNFWVGGGAHETATGGIVDREIVWCNNDAFGTQHVTLNIAGTGGFSLTPANDGWVYENDTPNANLQHQQHDGVTPVETLTVDSAAELKLYTSADGNDSDSIQYGGDGVHAGGVVLNLDVSADHELTGFHITNYSEIQNGGGVIYYQDGDGWRPLAIDGDGGYIPDPNNPGQPLLLDSNMQLLFIPGANYKDGDLSLNYAGTLTDLRTGDTAGSGPGSAHILVDAVAQQPGDVALADADIHGNVTTAVDAQQFSFAVTATFEDYTDNSELHYVLVESRPNIVVYGPDGVTPITDTFSIRSLDTDPASSTYGQYVYVNYVKVPVDNDYITQHGTLQPDGSMQVTVTVKAEIVADWDTWQWQLAHGQGASLHVGALSEETARDSDSNHENNYNNNFAYTLADGTVNIGWGGNPDPSTDLYGLRVDPVYENDRQYSHMGDENPPPVPGGSQLFFGSEVKSADVTLSLVDKNGDSHPFPADHGQIVDQYGVPVTPDTDGVYHLNLDDGPYYFVPAGHSDEDVHVDYTTHDAVGGEHTSATTIVVDAVANKPTWEGSYGDGTPAHPDDSWQPNTTDGRPLYEVKADYTDDLGVQHNAMGAADGHGNDNTASICVAGFFPDNDGSEKHYGLVEAQPGWTVTDADGNPAELVYIEGKAFFRVEMVENTDPSTPGNHYALDADGKEYANIKIIPPDSGPEDLRVGLMAEEQNYGTGSAGDAPADLELRTDNNVSWDINGIVHFETSFVDSSVSVAVPPDYYERGEGDPGFAVTIAITVGKYDTLNGDVTVTASGQGHFDLSGGLDIGGVHLSPAELLAEGFALSTDGTQLTIPKSYVTDFVTNHLADLQNDPDPTAYDNRGNDGVLNVTVNFEPDAYNDKDINFSCEATFTDGKSGDTANVGGGADVIVIVDAVANAPDFDPTVGGGVGFTVLDKDGDPTSALAVKQGGKADLAVNLHFADTDGSEKHYAVLEQGRIGHEELLQTVWMSGATATVVFSDGTTQDCPVITLYEPVSEIDPVSGLPVIQNKPYYAVEIPEDKLDAAGGDVTVIWHVTAPNIGDDGEYGLKAGGVSIETTTGQSGSPGGEELDLTNNWNINVQDVQLRIGKFDTDSVHIETAGQLREHNDSYGGADGAVTLTLDVPDMAQTNEKITQVVFTFEQDGSMQPGTVLGTVHCGGQDVEVTVDADGNATATLLFRTSGGYANGYDGSPVTFTLADGNHNSSDVKIASEITVRDIYLNDTTTVSGDAVTLSVVAVADTPTGVSASGGTGTGETVSAGEAIHVTVQAQFADNDGSENHYVLVEKPGEGWSCQGALPDLYHDPASGKDYFMVPATAAAGGAGQTVTLYAPNLVGDNSLTLQTGALAVEQDDTHPNGSALLDNSHGFQAGDPVSVHVLNEAHLAVTATGNTLAGAVTQGNPMSFTLALTDGTNSYTAGEPISATLKITSGDANPLSADTIAKLGADGWTSDGAGGYTHTFTLPAGSSSATFTIPTGTDNALGAGYPHLHVEVVSGSLSAGTLGAYVDLSTTNDSFDVTVTSGDIGRLALVSTVHDDGSLGFDLHLQNKTTGQDVVAPAAIMATFVLDNADHSLTVPDAWLHGTMTDSGGNSLNWTHNADGSYTVVATLADGQSTLDLGGLIHSASGDHLINANEALNVTLVGVTNMKGLAADINIDGTVTNQNVARGFTLVDSEYAHLQDYGSHHSLSFQHSEVDGKELVDLSTQASSTDGSHQGTGQVILGTAADETIHASTGNDVLIGGGGNDTFVWNHNNIGTGPGHVDTDVIKDFHQGDVLRFEDLFGGGDAGQHALDTLLNSANCAWTANAAGTGGDLIATAGSTSIHLNVAETAATLTVSYADSTGNYTQSVELQGFSLHDLHPGTLDQAAAVEALHEILKVTG